MVQDSCRDGTCQLTVISAMIVSGSSIQMQAGNNLNSAGEDEAEGRRQIITWLEKLELLVLCDEKVKLNFLNVCWVNGQTYEWADGCMSA